MDKEDFNILQKHYCFSFHSCEALLNTYEPIAIQLLAVVEKFGAEGQGGTCTSDSGAPSDYESSICETDELKSESTSSLVTICADGTATMPDDKAESTSKSAETTCTVDQDSAADLWQVETAADSDTTVENSANDSTGPNKCQYQSETVVTVSSCDNMQDVTELSGDHLRSDSGDHVLSDTCQSESSDDYVSCPSGDNMHQSESSGDDVPGDTSDHTPGDMCQLEENMLCNNEDSPKEENGTPSSAELLATESDPEAQEANGIDLNEFWAIMREVDNGDSSPRQETKQHDKKESDAIVAVELEKEFFSDSSEDISPDNHPHGDKRHYAHTPHSHSKRYGHTHRKHKPHSKWEPPEGSPYPTYQSGGRHYNNRRGYYRTSYRGRRGSYRGGRSTYRTEPRHSSHRHSELRKTDQNIKTDEQNANTDKTPNENHERKPELKHEEQKATSRTHQPSPLVVHSQNMWSANIDTVKSCRAKRVTITRRPPWRDVKPSADSSEFNHYEVGQFLMQGMFGGVGVGRVGGYCIYPWSEGRGLPQGL